MRSIRVRGTCGKRNPDERSDIRVLVSADARISLRSCGLLAKLPLSLPYIYFLRPDRKAVSKRSPDEGSDIPVLVVPIPAYRFAHAGYLLSP
jgi:hypothetical protein